MINKIYIKINNKFSSIFKFIFFLRYLIAIFFVAIVLFLSIPQFFDYKKKEQVIINYLLKNYEIELKKIKKIQFKSFPTPHLFLSNLETNFHKESIDLKINNMKIYPKLFSIFNYENFQVRKIELKNNNANVNIYQIIPFTKYLLNIEKKISIKNLSLKIKDKNRPVIHFEEINFSNYGYKKNKINGLVFNKKFGIDFENKFNKFNLKIPDINVSSNINTFKDDNSKLAGSLQGKILKLNLKLDFLFNQGSIKINNFLLRDKKLSLDSDGYFDFKPYFKINLKSQIKDIDLDLLKNFDLNIIFDQKDLLKRINSENIITFKSKKFSRDLISQLEIQTNLAYGRLTASKTFSINGNNFFCSNEVNLISDYPVLYFNCLLKSSDKKSLYKKLKIDLKTQNEPFNLKVKGNLNILNKKINFVKVEMNNKYNASQEDLEFFKNSFESILFDGNFNEIFRLSKIRKFIYEIN